MPQKNTKALKLYRADIAARAAAEAATDSDSGSESDSDYEEVPSHPRTTPMAENKLLLTVKLTRPTAKSETGAVTAAKPVTAAEPVTGAVATEAGAVAMETDAVATEAGAVAMETDAVATEAGAEAAAAEPAARGKKRRRPRPKMSSPAEAKQMLDTLGIQVRAELFKRSQELMFAAAAFSALETDQRKTEGFAERAQARAAKESRLAAEKAAKDAAKAAQKKIDDAAKAAKKEMERVDKAKVESAVSQIKDLFERYNKAGEISLAASSKPFDEATIRGLEGELRFDRTTSNIDTVCTRMMQPKTNAGVRDAVSKAFEMTTAVGRLPECVDVRVPDKLVAAKAKLDAFQVEAANAKAARLVLAQAAAATAAEAAAKAKAQQAALDSAAKLAAALGPRAHEGEPLEELPL